jgi:hypothetical protein
MMVNALIHGQVDERRLLWVLHNGNDRHCALFGSFIGCDGRRGIVDNLVLQINRDYLSFWLRHNIFLAGVCLIRKILAWFRVYREDHITMDLAACCFTYSRC